MIPTIKQMTATGKLCFRILIALIMRSTPPIKNIHSINSAGHLKSIVLFRKSISLVPPVVSVPRFNLVKAYQIPLYPIIT